MANGDKSKLELVAQEKISVLVIADDAGRDSFLIRSTLKNMGYGNIHLFTGADEAVSLIKSNIGTLMIVNAENKTMPGIEAVTRVKNIPGKQDFQAVLTCASLTAEIVMAAKSAGANAIIPKPIIPQKLIAQLYQLADFKLETLKKHVMAEEKAIKAKGLIVEQEIAEIRQLKLESIASAEYYQLAFPWSDDIVFALGELYLSVRMESRAVQQFTKALMMNDHNPAPLLKLSDIHASKGEYKRAAALIRQALSLRTELAALQKLGELQLRLGETEEAITTLTKCIQLYPDTKPGISPSHDGKLANAMNLRGEALLQKGQADSNENLINRAAEHFESAAKLSPDLVSAHFNLVVAYKKLGKTDAALGVMKSIDKISPPNTWGWLELAGMYNDNNDMHKTRFAMNQAKKLCSNEDELIDVMDKYFALNMLAEAEQIAATMSAKSPGDSFFRNKLGMIYRRQGKIAEAIVEYEAALEADPGDPYIWFNKGRAMMDNGDIAGAKEMFRKCQEIDPNLDIAGEFLKL